jgi:phosphoribosyl 1,2-cyclic phosphate phosphodiesterase
MRLIILGCGSSSGVPVVGGADGHGEWGECDPTNPKNRRTRASVYWEVTRPDGATLRLLVDTSPDMRAQLLANGLCQIDAVLYTHAHADHCHGIDEVRSLNFHKQGALPCYSDAPTLETLQRQFPYAFTPPKSYQGYYKPSLIPTLIHSGQPFSVEGVEVCPFWQNHGPIKSLGYRMGNVAYSTDCKGFFPETEHLLEGLDLWIVDCVQREPHHTHAHLSLTLSWIERFKPKRAVLTHLNASMDYETLTRSLPAGVEVAYDGMVLELP